MTESKLKKPELLIAAGSIDQIGLYVEAGATAVWIGDDRFGVRLPGAIREDELAAAVREAHDRGAKAYVNASKLLRNEELDGLPAYVAAVRDSGADAIVFGDPAVLLAAREHAPSLPLHWNAEMTGTNSAAASYWGRRGAVRAVLARELNGEEIADLKRSMPLEAQVQAHGMTNIYYSHRNLLQSYMEHLGRQASFEYGGEERETYLVEAERPDLRFPIFEDATGTHVMSPDDIFLLEALPELIDAGVDSLYVEALMKTPEYNATVLRAYRQCIDRYCGNPAGYRPDPEAERSIRRLQPGHRELGFGFLYKEQVY